MHSPKVPRPAWRADTNDTARPGRSRRESGTVLEARSYLSNADRLPSVAGVAVTPGSRSGMGDFSIFHMADRLGRFYGGDPARPKRLAGRNLTHQAPQRGRGRGRQDYLGIPQSRMLPYHVELSASDSAWRRVSLPTRRLPATQPRPIKSALPR